MNNTIEIRWHGRGGQGAKTAALLLADVAFSTGKYVQGFPEYGPERMGAPITAYNRISDSEIRVHSNIYEPQFVVVVDETLLEAVDVTKGLKKDGAIIVNTSKPKEEIKKHHSNIYEPQFVVVVDETLLEAVDVTKGLKKDGAIIVNTSKPKEEIKKHLKGYEGKLFTVDARGISEKALGKYFPNSPMLASIVKVANIMPLDTFLDEMKTSFKHKFASKPEVIGGNMEALKLALEEVE